MTKLPANNNHLYADRESRLNTLVGQITETSVSKYDHWRTLQKAKVEYDNLRIAQGQNFELDGFATWLEETYGIRLEKVEGMIGQNFNIVDDTKYTFYKLKFA